MTRTDAATLHAHADLIDHAAAVGGYVDDRTGERVTLGPRLRAAWAADAAVLREAAYRLAQDEGETLPGGRASRPLGASSSGAAGIGGETPPPPQEPTP